MRDNGALDGRGGVPRMGARSPRASPSPASSRQAGAAGVPRAAEHRPQTSCTGRQSSERSAQGQYLLITCATENVGIDMPTAMFLHPTLQ